MWIIFHIFLRWTDKEFNWGWIDKKRRRERVEITLTICNKNIINFAYFIFIEWFIREKQREGTTQISCIYILFYFLFCWVLKKKLLPNQNIKIIAIVCFSVDNYGLLELELKSEKQPLQSYTSSQIIVFFVEQNLRLFKIGASA